MSPLGRTGTYGCVTRTRYKREKGGRRLSEGPSSDPPGIPLRLSELKILQGRERKERTDGGREAALRRRQEGRRGRRRERAADSIRG